MNTDNRTPFVLGVTGHRAIRPQDLDALTSTVKNVMQTLQNVCPYAPIVLLSSLAEGADLLCADVAEELGIPIVAVLPREQADYAQDFSETARMRFLHHCSRAEKVFVTPNVEAVPAQGIDRDYQFRQAGIFVAAHCHVLLALWDGGPGTVAACGTAEAVDFALHHNYYPANGHIPQERNTIVVHVFTPRGNRVDSNAGTVRVLGDKCSLLNALSNN